MFVGPGMKIGLFMPMPPFRVELIVLKVCAPTLRGTQHYPVEHSHSSQPVTATRTSDWVNLVSGT